MPGVIGYYLCHIFANVNIAVFGTDSLQSFKKIFLLRLQCFNKYTFSLHSTISFRLCLIFGDVNFEVKKFQLNTFLTDLSLCAYLKHPISFAHSKMP